MTTEIEKTRHQMYADLKRFETMVGSTHLFKTFQDSLEAHLEELRNHARNLLTMDAHGIVFGDLCQFSIGGNYDSVKAVEHMIAEKADLTRRLAAMTEERDQIQGRLHAIDHAYCEQSNQLTKLSMDIGALERATKMAGEELIRVQGIARQHLDDVTQAGSIIRANKIEIDSLRGQLEARDKTIGELRKNYGRDREDLMSAEKLSDDLSDKLTHATTVIGQQEQLIAGQRAAIAELHMAGRGAKSAAAMLKRLGYTDCGGQLWKPPIGKKPQFDQCAHEFHPEFPGGERCVYCLEKNLTAAGETIAQMERYRSELCTNPTHISSCKCGRG